MNGIDWNLTAAALDELRAFLAAEVAAVKAEGFTDEQAHSIVADLIHYYAGRRAAS